MAESDGTGRDRGGAAPADGADRHERLQALGRKLDAARRIETSGPRRGSTSSLLGMAFRIAAELIAGLGVGGVVGWQLDRWLGTRPAFLLALIVLGAVGAFVNIFRDANRMHAAARKEDAESRTTDRGQGGENRGG